MAKLEGGVEAVNFGADYESKDEPVQGELIANETRLTRDQVLERYLTPNAEFTGEKPPDMIYEMPGAGEYALLSPTSSFIANQIRSTYSGPHIERTGLNIQNSECGQVQNSSVVLLSEGHVESYLADMNEYFESDIPLSDIEWHEKFNCYVVSVSGHHRQLGIAAVNKLRTGHPDHGMQIFAKVYRDASFWQMLEVQALENTGLAPNMWERSRSIVRYKELRARDGIPATQDEIAATFGVDSDQVRDAVRYEALPSEIKELVVEEKLPFSGSVAFDRLFGYYEQREVITIARRLAGRKASSKQIEAEVRNRLLGLRLTAEVKVLIDAGKITINQANELERLKNAGGNDGTINEVAQWILLASPTPKIEQVRSHVNDRIAKMAIGVEAFAFGEQDAKEAASEQDIHANANRLIKSQRKELIGQKTTKLMVLLSEINTGIKTGLLDREVLEGRPISSALAYDAGLLGRIVLGVRSGLVDQEVLQMILDVQSAETEVESGGVVFDRLIVEAERSLTEFAEANKQPESLF